MLVVSYLSQLLLPRLVDVVRDIEAEHIHASTWEEAEDIVRHRAVSVLVLDPYTDRVGRADEIARLLRQFPSTPVIAYTQFIPPALRALTLLAQYGLHETVLFQIDDGRARLGRLLVRASTHSLSTRMLNELQMERSRLAPILADAVDDLFRRPHAYTSGYDLVLNSRIPLTSLYRALQNANLAPPKQLFIAARVLHAIGYLRDPGYTVQEVAEKTGYRHPRVLTQHTLIVFRARPSALRNMKEDEMLPTLLQYARCTKSDRMISQCLAVTEHAMQGRIAMQGQERLQTTANELTKPDNTQAIMSAHAALLALREEILNVDIEPGLRNALLTSIQAVLDAPKTDPAPVMSPWLAYGKDLESMGHVELAAHVYQTMINVLDARCSSDSLLTAMTFMQYGYVARFLGNFDASETAYKCAGVLADSIESRVISLRARIGIVNTLKARGNLGDAEQVLAEAISVKMVDAEAWALHTRGMVRMLRDRHVDAMIDFFRAYDLMQDTSEREVLLGDLAGCAWEAGYRQMARDSYRILAYTAREPLVRSAALGNLLEYSTYDGTLADFERLQEEIAEHARKHPLPAEHAIHVALYTAYGVERFDTCDATITAYRSVITRARDEGFHQIAFKAEERLAAFLAGTTTPNSLSVHEPPDTLRPVVDAIAKWSAHAIASA